MMTERVGFIGMGIMGSPMAINLARAGVPVTVYNRNADKCRAAAAAGASVARSIADVVRNSDVVWLMVANDAAVNQIALGRDGVAAHARKGLLVIDSSTVHPGTSRELATALAAKDAEFLDAPVTGSKPQAETGKLFFLVGGSETAYRRAVPLFETMGRRHIHLGGVGMGACAKLCNNLMGFINLAGFCEALTIAQSFGLAPQKLYDVIIDSGGKSAIAEGKGPKMLREDWSPDFSLGLAHKDLELARQLATELHRPVPVVAAAASSFAAAKQAGEGGNDVAALYRWYST